MSAAMRRVALSLLLIGVLPTAVGAGATTGPTGTLTVAYATLFDENLNPLLGPAPSKAFYDVMYEYLVYNDPQTLKAEPGLAERWSMSPDGKRWIFFLRKGVTFSDAEAVQRAVPAVKAGRTLPQTAPETQLTLINSRI
jgi:peptide/nickel transport system substrate-binding protein